MAFAKEWGDRLPLAIVPTKYYSTPTDAFRKANISLVIWANHMIRSSTKEMIKNSKKIFKSKSVTDIEDRIGFPLRILYLKNPQNQVQFWIVLIDNLYLKHLPLGSEKI